MNIKEKIKNDFPEDLKKVVKDLVETAKTGKASFNEKQLYEMLENTLEKCEKNYSETDRIKQKNNIYNVVMRDVFTQIKNNDLKSEKTSQSPIYYFVSFGSGEVKNQIMKVMESYKKDKEKTMQTYFWLDFSDFETTGKIYKSVKSKKDGKEYKILQNPFSFLNIGYISQLDSDIKNFAILESSESFPAGKYKIQLTDKFYINDEGIIINGIAKKIENVNEDLSEKEILESLEKIVPSHFLNIPEEKSEIVARKGSIQGITIMKASIYNIFEAQLKIGMSLNPESELSLEKDIIAYIPKKILPKIDFANNSEVVIIGKLMFFPNDNEGKGSYTLSGFNIIFTKKIPIDTKEDYDETNVKTEDFETLKKEEIF